MEKFTYVINGVQITLPRFEDIEVGAIRQIRRLSQIDQIFTLIEYFLTEEELAAFDTLKRINLEEFAEAWRSGSSITLGESSASSTS